VIRRDVVVLPSARSDLREIFRWIADRSSEEVALNYLERIENYIARFDLASERGTTRDETRSGLRTIGFEGRLTIAFLITETEVQVLRVLRAGRNWSDAFD
jgi:toxin ParE1/3/4